MRATLQRWAEPVLRRLPDPSRVPIRRQIAAGIIASLVVHLLGLLFLIGFVGLLPERIIEFAKPKPRLQDLEVELQPLEPEPEIIVLPLNEPMTIDSKGLTPSDKAPEDPTFQSDVDMVAASENPANGDAPLPSVKGRSDLPFIHFKTQEVSLGPPDQPAPATPAADAEPPQPRPLFKPQPIPKEFAELQKRAMEAEPPKPALKTTENQSDPDSLPVGIADDRPPQTKILPPLRPKPIPEEDPSPEKTPPTEMAKLITPPPRPQPIPRPGYVPHMEQTRVEGSISNRGRAGVDAIKTPLASYKKQVSDAIGSRWTFYTAQRKDLLTLGQARMRFVINRRGQIERVETLSNTSNDRFDEICRRAIAEAELRPPPPDVSGMMQDGRIEFVFSFTLY